MIERTLVLLKPDAVQRALCGAVLSRFENIGLKIVGAKMVWATPLVGPTEPRTAPPGTIRGDYAHISTAFANEKGKAIKNLIHASGNPDEAREELALWFAPKELHSYKTVHELHVM